jgi:hypothetical protein
MQEWKVIAGCTCSTTVGALGIAKNILNRLNFKITY